MKHFIFSAAAAIALCAAATSCSSDEPGMTADGSQPIKDGQTLTVKAAIPTGVRISRAGEGFTLPGQGNSLRYLQYAVYTEDGTIVEQKDILSPASGGSPFTGSDTHSFTLTLEKGKNYKLCVFATGQNYDGQPGMVADFENKTISMGSGKYPNMSAWDAEDSFLYFGDITKQQVNNGTALDVTLTRPFVQIAWVSNAYHSESFLAKLTQEPKVNIGFNVGNPTSGILYTEYNFWDDTVKASGSGDYSTEWWKDGGENYRIPGYEEFRIVDLRYCFIPRRVDKMPNHTNFYLGIAVYGQGMYYKTISIPETVESSTWFVQRGRVVLVDRSEADGGTLFNGKVDVNVTTDTDLGYTSGHDIE